MMQITNTDQRKDSMPCHGSVEMFRQERADDWQPALRRATGRLTRMPIPQAGGK